MLNVAAKINELAPILIIALGLIKFNPSSIIFGVILFVGYDVEFSDSDYNWYYLFCGLVNYLALELSSKLKTPDYNLLLTIYLFFYINLLGWLNWMRYIGGDSYTILCAINYVFITILLIGGKDGVYKLDIRDYIFYLSDSSRVYNSSFTKKEKRV